ncbi:nitrite reductase small subunit NirD [Citricoccus nitrophenolicus]|uniref:nitrite reductase small subunit NirD n=1 Tax=Citricoccus nitrophenolicus TaxID=863575 RepID=UPI0039B4CC3E
MTLTATKPATEPATQPATDWLAVCRLDELEPLYAEAALVHGEQVALIRLPSDEVMAVSHWDPHAQAYVMARGIVGSRDGSPTLASPLHKQVYDLTTGRCLTEPDLRIRSFPVRVRDRIVEVLAA